MNGRVYDYNLGRFLSVDPLIQSPTNSQSINPYSYIMNNPLAGVDPTGYCSAETGTRIKKCVDVTMKDVDTEDSKTVSVNVKHSNAASHISSAVSSFFNGAVNITGVTAQTGSGKTMDLMNQQTLNTQTNDIASPTNNVIGGTIDTLKGVSDGAKELENAGLVLHADGKARVDTFTASGRADISATDVKKAELSQARLAKAGKVLGPLSYGFVGYVAVDDYISWDNGDISDDRYSYKIAATTVPLALGFVSLPASLTAGSGFYLGELTYDTANLAIQKQRQFVNRANRQNMINMERSRNFQKSKSWVESLLPDFGINRKQ